MFACLLAWFLIIFLKPSGKYIAYILLATSTSGSPLLLPQVSSELHKLALPYKAYLGDAAAFSV